MNNKEYQRDDNPPGTVPPTSKRAGLILKAGCIQEEVLRGRPDAPPIETYGV